MRPLKDNGHPVYPEELDDGDEILAILPDDRIVLICGHDRFRVGSGYGCGGSNIAEDWLWLDEPVIQAPSGLYARMIEFPAAIKAEAAARKADGRAWVRFEKMVHVTGHQALTDMEIAAEIVSDGWSSIFSRTLW